MKINKFIIPFAAAALLFSACDSISPDDRYIEVEAVKPKRAVLIEEFTGQNCPNCPEGHTFIAQLREQYGSSFIPVSIHASNLSIAVGSNPLIEGLGTTDGEAYYKNAGSPVLPSGVVDRRTEALGRDEWAKNVREEMQREAPAAIEITTGLPEGSKELSITVNVKPTADINGHLQVWLIESGIIAYQLNGRVPQFEYVHNHVFRAAVNGTNGESFTASKNVFDEKSYTYTLDNSWKPENMAVVAFIYNSTGILQAAEADVVPTETSEDD